MTDLDFSDPVWLRLGFINENRYNWYSGTARCSSRRSRPALLDGAASLASRHAVVRNDPAAGGLCRRRIVLARRADVGRRGRALFAAGSVMAAARLSRPMPAGGFSASRSSRTRSRCRSRRRGPCAFRTSQAPRWQSSRSSPLPGCWFDSESGTFCCRPSSFSWLSWSSQSTTPASSAVYGPSTAATTACSTIASGRLILQKLLAGDIAGFLEGGEKVFYYGGPGLRYFRALEHIVFGETYLGYLSLILLLPFIALGLFRRFLAGALVARADPFVYRGAVWCPVRHQFPAIRRNGRRGDLPTPRRTFSSSVQFSRSSAERLPAPKRMVLLRSLARFCLLWRYS